VRALENDENAGFPAACNQGLEVARGDRLVLLNSDTMVPPGWLRRLLAPIEHDPLALTGPVTNRIGNEAEVPTTFATWGDFLREARVRGDSHSGQTFPIPTLTMFCLAMSRDAYDLIGSLDVRYGVGMLEDDDYSMRARQAGCGLLCVEDALVHHFGEASFGKLFDDGEHGRIITRNRQAFEAKWGAAWEPYERRADDEYAGLVDAVRTRLREGVPPGSTVLVVSNGDDAMLEVDGVEAWHFPRAPDGGWAGHHPADSDDAIARLEEARAYGAAFIAFPRTLLWWLDFYEGLARHLAGARCEILRDESLVVFDLAAAGVHEGGAASPAAGQGA
jgi:hypothetical protein